MFGRLPVAELLVGAKADVNAIDVSRNLISTACINEFQKLLFIRNSSLLLIFSRVVHVLRQYAFLIASFRSAV